jgi:hypothetical protein
MEWRKRKGRWVSGVSKNDGVEYDRVVYSFVHTGCGPGGLLTEGAGRYGK